MFSNNDAPKKKLTEDPVFRPFKEPLINLRLNTNQAIPKNNDNGPMYDPIFKPHFETVYRDEFDPDGPKDIKIVTPNKNGSDIFADKKNEISVNDLIPEDEDLHNYLPTIRAAIRLVTLKKKAVLKYKEWSEKTKTTWRHFQKYMHNTFKHNKQQSAKISDWVGITDWEKFAKEAAAKVNSVPPNPVNDSDLDTTPVGFVPLTPRGLSWQEDQSQLETAYSKLREALTLYDERGLLYYQPLLTTSGALRGEVENVIKSWSQLYEHFTRDYFIRIDDCYIPSETFRANRDLHLRLQKLPASIIKRLPAFPMFRTALRELELVAAPSKPSNYLKNAITAIINTSDILFASLQTLPSVEWPSETEYQALLKRNLTGKTGTLYLEPPFTTVDLWKFPRELCSKLSKHSDAWEMSRVWKTHLQETEKQLEENNRS